MIAYFRPDDPLAVSDEIVRLFGEVFAEPPYYETDEDAAAFAETFARQTQQPGFALVIARHNTGLVGFAYGHTQPPGWWWKDRDVPPPTQLLNAEKFVVYEWAVAKDCRGQGIGRTLLEQLLHERPEPWATLSVNIGADAYGIYQRAGWRQVGARTAPDRPPLAAMARRLPPRRSATSADEH